MQKKIYTFSFTKLLFALLLLGSVFTAQAQKAYSVQYEGKKFKSIDKKNMACADQFAGTIEFQNFQGQSDDFDPQTPIFMCLGDTYDIVHQGDQDLTGDPNTGSQPGIVYLFYEGQPTVEGPDLDAILGDPSLINNPAPSSDFFSTSTSGSINGNITLSNTGFIQNHPLLGNPNGVQIWFAPVTIDNFQQNLYESNNTGVTGPCVNANIDDFFSVVYLNAIEQNGLTQSGLCSNTFQVDGGLPKFDGVSSFDISIVNTADNSIEGTVTNSAPIMAGDFVEFSVPQYGTYQITVSDGKSCELVFNSNIFPQNEVILSASNENVPVNSAVCVDFFIENVNQLVSLQFTIDYDETIVTFASFQNFHPNLPNLNNNVNDLGSEILISHVGDVINGHTLTDNSLLFEICFDVIGNPGDVSAIIIDGSNLPLEASDICGEIDINPTSGSISITNQSFAVNVNEVDEVCSGAMDGSFILEVSGGNAPYTMEYMNSAGNTTTQNINTEPGTIEVNSLAPGLYTITVADANGNIVMATAEIEQGLQVGASVQLNSPTCSSNCDGSVLAAVSENAVTITPGPGYQFNWNTGQMTQGFGGLCGSATNYMVVVTSPEGCTGSASGTLSSPAPINPNEFITNPSCSGSDDGQIQLNITGGVDPIIASWPSLGLANSVNIVGLSEGTYCVEITDANQCSHNECFEIEPDKVITLQEAITAVTCAGSMDGSILVNVSTLGGTSNSYTYNWTGSNPVGIPVNTMNSTQINNLSPGTYILLVTDDEGCNSTMEYVVDANDPLVITLESFENETCTTGDDGTATISVTGGEMPYFYDWGIPNGDSETISNQSAGTYTVTVTDGNQCTAELPVTLSIPSGPTILDLEDDMINCSNDMDGILTVNAVEVDSPIQSYLWSNNENTPTIENLGPGDYSVTITDEAGCTTEGTASVTAPTPIALIAINTELTNCPNEGGGLAAVTVTGGTPPYFYTWSNGTIGQNVTTITGADVVAGNYSVVITDQNGCGPLEIQDILVSDPPSIGADFSDIEGVSCANGQGVPFDGEATATAFYEDDPGNSQGQLWNFIWTSIDTSNPGNETVFHQEFGTLNSTATNLPPGEQFVIISDGQCFDTLSVMIPSPEALGAVGESNSVSCNGDMDGSVTINPEGGIEPYIFNWSNGAGDVDTVNDLPPGQISVMITDDNGCTFTLFTEVGEPEPFTAFLLAESQEFVSCFDGNDGLLSIGTNGGNPGPIIYNWPNNIAQSSQSVANNLPAGSYNIEVVDSQGCTNEVMAIITAPEPIVFDFSVGEIECYNGTAVFMIEDVMGGTAADISQYGYRFNNQPNPVSVLTPRNIGAGQYEVIVVDALGCESSQTFELSQPNELIIELPETIIVELGDTTVNLNPIVVNDFPLDSILWSPAGFLSNDSILNPFILNTITDMGYTLTVQDVNGCTGIGSIFVEIDRNRNVYVPNAFSPNRDGSNDIFGVHACTGVKEILSAEIYGRWGELLASVKNILPECFGANGTKIWDGSFNGKEMPNGVYAYLIQIEFIDGKVLTYRGDLTLLR